MWLAYIKTNATTRQQEIKFLAPSNDIDSLDYYKQIELSDEEIDIVLTKNKDAIQQLIELKASI